MAISKANILECFPKKKYNFNSLINRVQNHNGKIATRSHIDRFNIQVMEARSQTVITLCTITNWMVKPGTSAPAGVSQHIISGLFN